MKWYCKIDESIRGPYSQAQLKRRAVEGKLPQRAQLRVEGETVWRPLTSFPQFVLKPNTTPRPEPKVKPKPDATAADSNPSDRPKPEIPKQDLAPKPPVPPAPQIRRRTPHDPQRVHENELTDDWKRHRVAILAGMGGLFAVLLLLLVLLLWPRTPLTDTRDSRGDVASAESSESTPDSGPQTAERESESASRAATPEEVSEAAPGEPADEQPMESGPGEESTEEAKTSNEEDAPVDEMSEDAAEAPAPAQDAEPEADAEEAPAAIMNRFVIQKPDSDPAEPEEKENKDPPKTSTLLGGSNSRGRGKGSGGGFEGRSKESREALVAAAGGTEESESAVERALKWLKEHQMKDGSWDFNLHSGPCQGRCQSPGRSNALNGATAMGVLPFLGAGHTHRSGEYREVVRAALSYLVNSITATGNGGSFEDNGDFYSHGLASIALCEAYAMTEDRWLHVPTREALAYIRYSQDPRGGGWRYNPRQSGDTSVVGWQVMALKSGELGRHRISPDVLNRVNRFLDRVQADGGAAYGYLGPGDRPFASATSAIGLLIRMYLGWTHDEPALKKGIERLSRKGPSNDNMYYNYYATQVMHHYGGDLWENWNEEMRDYLVQTQIRDPESHEHGSWHFGGGHSNAGGRLYSTSMATMTLEVYYRHLPIYGKNAIGN